MTQKAKWHLQHKIQVILVRVFICGLAIVCGSGWICFGQTCDTWEWRAPTPQGNDLSDATLHNNNLIFCGKKGTILERVADDWVHYQPPTLTDFHGIASNGSVLVCVGPKGTVATLSNMEWMVNQISISGAFHTLNDVLFAGGQFVAVGRSGKIITSTDGQSWTPQTTGVIAHLNSISYDGSDYWVTGSTGTLLKSSDAVTWVSVNSQTGVDLHHLVFGGGRWIAVGNVSTISVSSDGNNFTERFVPNATNYRRIGWDGTRYVMVGTNGKVATSNDGISWASATLSQPENLDALQFAGGHWFCGGTKGVIFEGDGTEANWVLKKDILSTGSIRGVAEVGNTVYILDSNGLIQSSTNLDDWSPVTQVPNFSGYAIATNGSSTIFAGSASKVYLITGSQSTWNFSLGGFLTFRGATWWQDRWIVVGDSGSIFTFSGGVTWEPQDAGTMTRLRAVVGSPARLVAVGDDGTILYSNDSETWQAAASPTTKRLVTVDWNGSYFLAAGSQGTLIKSFDGIQWTELNLPFSTSIQDVTWGLNMWGMALIGGGIYTSLDGESWEQAPFATTFTWETITPVKNQWAVAGNLGNLVTGSCDFCSPPDILDPSQMIQACAGEDLTLAPLVAGGPFTQVFWTRDGTLLNETSLILNLNNVTAADSGTYKLQLNNECGFTQQTIAEVLVEDPFSFSLPVRTLAKGNCIFEIEALLNCGSGDFEVQWWRADFSEILATGNSLTLNPEPTETLELVAIATDQVTNMQLMQPFTLLVSQDPQLFDFNGDGTNSVDDLMAYLPFWGESTPDANADGVVDVRDFLYINTLGNQFCAPLP